ncbi:MAG TPA: alginate export family protein [Novosphingobium sp.]|nr:alginate export family protein [Novosphingobium sp.]HMP55198.1 alginate export family protein [Novosphingobium sp.]
MRKLLLAATALAAPVALAHPAFAAPGDPVKLGDGLTLDPIVEARLRYEGVDTPALDADAVTVRLRAGAELRHASGLSLLVEGEGTLALGKDYNAFPFPIADSQRRPAFAVVPDPMNIDLNRAQVQYKSKAATVTVGRQRINLDDQRFVGSVAWRQNEQTFDAARLEAKLGPVSLDGTYAISQHTIFGIDAGPRQAFDGEFAFLGASAKLGPVTVKAFSYLLDFDAREQAGALARPNADTQTYGLRAAGTFPLSPKTKLTLTGSYARQMDWKTNPADFSAEYVLGEAALAHGPLGLTAGYEKLGADKGRSVQTPMATLHKFQGWADQFLVTPAGGIEDWYLGASYRFTGVKALPGLNAAVTWHRFESDTGSLHYGNEWNASLGFKLGRTAVLVKYADYDAAALGVDTRKLWLQVELAY